MLNLRKDKKGASAIMVMGIILACITVAVGTAVGLALIGKTEDVVLDLGLDTRAGGPESAFNDTVGTIYSSWPLMGLIVLALIGAGVLVAIMVLK